MGVYEMIPQNARRTGGGAVVPSILITGVSTGIGRASAIGSPRGLVGRRHRARSARAERLDAVALEALDLAAVASGARRRVLGAHGCPDVLLNNAGSCSGARWSTTRPRSSIALPVNVFGQIELIRAFLPAMRVRGSGTIVNVTSLGGRLVFPFFAVYNATKHALEGFSEGLWHEVKPFGMRVKAIEPGYVETPSRARPARPKAARGRPYRPTWKRCAFEGSITDAPRPRPLPRSLRARSPTTATGSATRSRHTHAISCARRAMGDSALMRFLHKRWMGPTLRRSSDARVRELRPSSRRASTPPRRALGHRQRAACRALKRLAPSTRRGRRPG